MTLKQAIKIARKLNAEICNTAEVVKLNGKWAVSTTRVNERGYAVPHFIRHKEK